MHMRYWVALTILAALPAGAQGNTTPAPGTAVLDERDQLIRQRYEQVLTRDPLQDAAFDRVYESYMLTEGVDAWLATLKPAEGQEESAASLILRGRILARQFKTADAVEALSKARNLGEASPAFNALLGRLYYETGKDADAITLLGAALVATGSPEQRSELCRMLGSVYLRAGKRAEAAGVWERIAELNPGDLFALQELAEIYEENRLWDEAIAARKRIVEAASNDPYRQCSAWRAIGQSLLAKEDPAGAIAAFEQGLALAAPGNWLFEDLKSRLVAVYESRGDLEGLSAYLEARIAQDATDVSLSELLADVTLRRGDAAKAEGLLKEIVAREPGRISALEKLIELYRQAGRADDLAATFEALIAQYPAEPDYLRRLGEAWLEQKSPEKAQAAWRRVLGDGSSAANHALLAEWLERSEFFPEAAAEYEAALAIQPDREWRLRLASLKYDRGEEEAALAAWQAAVAPETTPAGEVAEIAGILASKEFKVEAEALYARAMTLAPENLEYVLAYARLLTGRGEHTAAVTQYTRLAEQDTSEYLKGEGERGLLDAYEALGTLETQRAAWEEAIANAPGDIVPRLKLARLYARLGNRPGVVKIYEECAAIDPARLDFQRLLAAAYKENRQTEKAVGVLEGLMEKDGERAQAYLRDLLALYGTLGRAAESIRSAEKLVELSPSSPEARTALAQVYLRNGEAEKGLQQYRDLIQLDGSQSAYYRDFGDALQQLGKFGEAQEVYRKMLDAATDDNTRLDAVNRLAQVYVRNGQRDVLLAEFQRRITATPKSLPAYQELAAVYRAAGDARGALETLERARGEVEDREAVLRLIMTEAYQSGDQQKVVTAYEELLARSATPTPYDLDRLASAYVQVGRADEAQAVWQRIARENPDDAVLQLMVARQMEAQGLYDESNACTERALAIDPFDHALRFEYAQRLLGFNEVDRGLEQMQKILDIGERPESAPAKPASATAPPQNPSFPTGMNPWGSGINFRRQSGSFGGSRSRLAGQSYDELRQQVVQTMVQLSRQFDGVTPILETYRKRIEAQPENIDARRDYLLVCEASGENALALETAQALLALQPDDNNLRWRIFGYLQELGQVDEAIAAAAELAKLPDPNLSGQARLMEIRLLAQNKRFDEAQAVLAEITGEAPAMAQIYFQVAGSFQEADDPEVADRLYQKAAELDPGLTHQVLTGRARLRQERGEGAAARDLYIEAVFAPRESSQNNPVQMTRRIPPTLYMPQGAQRFRQTGNNIAQLPGYNYVLMDHQRAEALNQAYRLCSTPEEFEPVIARLRDASAKFATADSDAARVEASNYASFLVACLRNTGREDEALAVVQSLLAERPGDLPLQNIALFLYDEQGKYDEMKGIYAAVESATPSLAGDVARARLELALAKEDIAAIPALFRALPVSTSSPNPRQFGGGRSGQIGAVVRVLENGGARAEARALLEEELARSRDAGILTLLSRSYMEEKNYEQAIAFAREAYEKQGGIRPRGSNNQYSMNALALQSQGLYGLEVLWSAYREAGREGELIKEFESRIEGQPTSITLRQALVGLYMENHQNDLARSQMEKLLELRPNDIQMKVRYAGLLEANNDPAGALAQLESIAAARPAIGRNIAGEIQRLYKDLGKKDELAALQERMIREARSAEELQQLGRQLGQEKDFVRAAEVLQRAQRLEPENTWLFFEVGDYLWQADRKSEAIDAYLKFFKPTTPQSAISIDTGRMPEIITRMDQAGRLDDLKAIAAGTPSNDFSVRSLKILSAQIASYEKRPEEAEQILKALVDTAPDQQVYSLLADMAEKKGDFAAAIQSLEASVAVAGATDYQRVAMLYLRTGDTAKAIQNWKKFVEQQGGFYGIDEALRSLDGAGAFDAVASYFREVYDALPKADQQRKQLASAIIRFNLNSGRYDALIDEVVFTPECDFAGELIREYARDYQTLPGAAIRRLAPLVERYPQDPQVQALYAEILNEAGRDAQALSIYEKLMEKEENKQNLWDSYVNALRRSRKFDKLQEVVLARLRGESNPPDGLIQMAFSTVVEQGGLKALTALRDELLASAGPTQQRRIKWVYFSVAANNGNLSGADPGLAALVKESPDTDALISHFQFLVQTGYLQEAASLYRDFLLPQGSNGILRLSEQDVSRALMAAGDPQRAWEYVLLVLRQQRDYYNTGLVSRVLEQFQEYNMTASQVEPLLVALKSQSELSIKDRLVLAEAEIALGHFPEALALLKDHMDNPYASQLFMNSNRLVPADLRDSLGMTGVPPEDSRVTAPAAAINVAVTSIHAAESAAEQGNKPEAIALLDGVDMGGNAEPLHLMRARAYAKAEATEKAIADYDVHVADHPEDFSARMERAILKGAAGRVPEAMDDWHSINPQARSNMAATFVSALAEQKHYDEALAVLDEQVLIRDNISDLVLLHATILHKAGQDPAMIALMEERAPDFSKSQQSRLAGAFADLLLHDDLWKSLMGEVAGGQRPFLARAFLQLSQRYQEDTQRDTRRALADALQSADFKDRESLSVYANLLNSVGRRDDAIKALFVAAELPEEDAVSNENLVDQLYNLEAVADALRLQLRLAGTPSRVFRRGSFLLQMAAKAGDPALMEEVSAQLMAAAPAEVDRDYFAAIKAWYGPDKADGKARLEKLADYPEISLGYLNEITQFFSENDDRAQLVKIYSRIAHGGFGSAATTSASARLVALYQKAGDLPGALDAFVSMLPATHDKQADARESVIACAARGSFDTANHLILERVQAAPAQPTVSDLLVLRAILARRMGVTLPPLDLETMGVPAGEIAEARLWGNLIDTWVVSKPMEVRSWTEMSAPLDDSIAILLRGDATATLDPAQWRAVKAPEILPHIQQYGATWPEAWNLPQGWSSFCLVELESPDDRTVTFAHGSAGGSRIWVNDSKVFSNPYTRIDFAGADQFEATLKKGMNRILVKVWSGERGASFTLSILKNGEGVIHRAPQIQGRPAVAAVPN